jgi:hypothetical protein
MFRLSREAYEKCLALLPKDSLWHYGYADLLWTHYYFDIYFSGEPDTEGIFRLTLSHLQTALQIDPKNQRARELLEQISYSIPGVVKVDGDGFIYLGLTATPLPPTPFGGLPTETSIPPPTEQPTMVAAAEATLPAPEPTVEPLATPEARLPNPICGSASLILPGLAFVFWLGRRKRIGI